MLGTAKSFNDSNGAKAEPVPFFGGVRGKSRQNAASANEAMPATRNVLVKAASIAGPVLGVPSAFPIQEMTPPPPRSTELWPSRSG